MWGQDIPNCFTSQSCTDYFKEEVISSFVVCSCLMFVSFFTWLFYQYPHYWQFSILTAGIPNIKWFGVEGDYNVLVMDLLGPSLEDLFTFCSRKLSLKTVLMLADQMVIHSVWSCLVRIFKHFNVSTCPIDLCSSFSLIGLSMFILSLFCIEILSLTTFLWVWEGVQIRCSVFLIVKFLQFCLMVCFLSISDDNSIYSPVGLCHWLWACQEI